MARTVASRKRQRLADWTKSQSKKPRTKVISIVPRNKFGFSETNRTNLRYVDNYLLTSTLGSTPNQQMRMNGIFDPDLTGGGHQPMWRDNFAAIYQNYRVISSRIKVTFLPNPTVDNGTIGPYVVGIVGATETTTPSVTVSTRQEMSDSVYKSITRYDEPNVLYMSYTPRSKLSSSYDEDTVSALVGANPSQQYIANVWFSDLTQPATSLLWATVEIDFVVEFFKLTLQAQN